MKGTIYNDGFTVLNTDLQNSEDTKATELRDRLVNTASRTGVTSGLVVSNGTVVNKLSVSLGVAYDEFGDVIDVPTNQIDVPALDFVDPGDIGKSIVVEHTDLPGTPRSHPVTGVAENTRQTDSFTFSLVTTPGSGQVVLATIDSIAAGIATLGTATRETYSGLIGTDAVRDDAMRQDGSWPGTTNISMIWHHLYSASGTGTKTITNPHGLSPTDIGVVDPTPAHQEAFHSTGIAGRASSTAYQVTVNSGASPDELDISAPTASDPAIIDGQRITSISATSIVPTGLNFDLFEVYVDNTGAPATSIRMTFGSPIASATVEGVYIIDISEGHGTGSHDLSWDDTAKTLTWSGGTAVVINTSDDAIYILYDDDDINFVQVFVDASTLNAIGSNETDSWTVNAGIDRDTNLLLATVPWSGTADGELGYGPWRTSGDVVDKRQFGTLGIDNLRDDVDEYLAILQREAVGNGVVRNLKLSKVGGSPSLDVTWEGGEAWVNGYRFQIPEPSSPLTLGSSNPQFVYVDDTGTVVTADDDPRLATPVPEVAMIAEVETNGTDDILVIMPIGTLPLGAGTVILGEKMLSTDLEAGFVPRARSRYKDDSVGAKTYLWEVTPSGQSGTPTFEAGYRIYARDDTATGGPRIEYVWNAYWDPDAAEWIREDTAATSMRVRFVPETATMDIEIQSTSGPDNWADTAWDTTGFQFRADSPNRLILDNDGYLDFNNVGSTGNPAGSTAISNELRPKNIVKAWGHCRTDGAAGLSIDEGFNITAAVVAPYVVVTLGTGMASSTLIAFSLAQDVVGEIRVLAHGATSITIESMDSTGANRNLGTTSGVDLYYIVCGAQS